MFKTVRDVCVLLPGLWAPALSCVPPEAGLAGLISDRPPLPGETLPSGSWSCCDPQGGRQDRLSLNTLTHGSLTPFKGCDFLQSDPHGSIGFGRERWLTRGTGRLELGQVHQQRPCGADASIQP